MPPRLVLSHSIEGAYQAVISFSYRLNYDGVHRAEVELQFQFQVNYWIELQIPGLFRLRVQQKQSQHFQTAMLILKADKN